MTLTHPRGYFRGFTLGVASGEECLQGDLLQPRTERRTGDRAFTVAAPRAWNRLPTELKLTRSTTATFWRHLKSFLFRTAY